jgi:O-methyltransferase involved in polyketide biosynthesis
VESVPNIDPSDHEKAIERMQAASERWRDHGFDLDFAELVYLGDRNEAAAYLGDHGWQLSRQSVKELFAVNGLPPLDDDEEAGNFGELQYVSGTLSLPGPEEDSRRGSQR